jgi:crooked neck
VAQGETELARLLYERLLERTVHVKVWISFAKFEMSSDNGDPEFSVSLARRVYDRANDCLRQSQEKESRVLLLEAWRDFEKEHGDEDSLKKVLEKMPRRVKKRQKIVSDSGQDEGWEEIFDYIFPEDEMARPNLKLLAAAKNWKKKLDDPVPEARTEPEEAVASTSEQVE